MVWAMCSPSSLGVYFPAGDYVGWREKLIAYYKNEMTPEEKVDDSGPDYAFRVADKFKFEHRPRSGARNLSPIRVHEAPDCYKLEKNYSDLGSMIMLTNHIWAVEEALKNIIEQLEPNVHEFYPIEIIMPKGKVYPKSYFLLVVGQYLESFSLTKSKAGTSKESSDFPGQYRLSSWTKIEIGGLAFEKSKFGNAHLWRERNGGEPDVFFSDRLKVELDLANLRIPKHFRAIEV
jgi:hypothetical protein